MQVMSCGVVSAQLPSGRRDSGQSHAANADHVLNPLMIAALPRPLWTPVRGAKRCAEVQCVAAPRPKRRLSGKGPAERLPNARLPAYFADNNIFGKNRQKRPSELLALRPSSPAALSGQLQQHSKSQCSSRTRPLPSPNAVACCSWKVAEQQLFVQDALGVDAPIPGDCLSHSFLSTPDRRVLAGTKAETVLPRVLGWRSSGKCSLDAAIGASNQKFDVLLEQFYIDHLAHEDNDKEACQHGERLSEEHYEDLCRLFVALLSWTDHTEMEEPFADGLSKYVVLEFQGSDFRCHNNMDAENAELLAIARAYSSQGRARDALCAVAAALASRREKSWIEAFDIDFELAERQKELSKESKPERLEVVMADMALRGVRGHFAYGLVSPRSSFRFAVAKPPAHGFSPRPASLLLSYRLPLIEAFEQMDDGGPLPEDWPAEAASHSSSCVSVAEQSPAWEFALQELDAHGRGGRFPLHLVSPEPSLSALLSPTIGAKDVILLDAVAALAPRSKAKEHGLSDIVKSELADFLSRAKSRSQAVVFMLGGDEPHVLAEKVYLQPPFTDHGLRCGYLRWRQVGAKAWAKEKPQDQRVCIGLQLP